MTRVAITTSVPESIAVAAAFTGEGLEPVLLPCIMVHPATPEDLALARRQAADADLIVVTSARAVSITWDGASMPDVPVAAVGPGTAGAVREFGGVVVATGPGGAADLVRRLDVDGKRVFFPHARAADPATFEGLTRRGAVLTASEVYDTTPVAPAHDRVDAVAFGSPLAVAGWTSSRDLEGLVVGAIGRTTADAVREAGHPDPVVPASPGFLELARQLARRIRDE